MPASEISLKSAKEDKLFYFVANVVVYRESDGRCLLLQRSSTEKVHPSRYGVLGGKLEWKDLDLTKPGRMNGDVIDFPDGIFQLLAREAHEEAGVAIRGPLVFVNGFPFVRPDGIPVVLMKFAARYDGGEVVLEKGSFDDYKWATAEEAKTLPCIEGIVEEVTATINAFQKENA